MRRFSKHLWYLSETLAFFDTDVTVGEKVEMVRALQRQAPSDDPPRRFNFEENKTTQKKLTDFDNMNTRKFFVTLVVTEEFQQEDPTTWDTNNAYIQTQTKARQSNVRE